MAAEQPRDPSQIIFFDIETVPQAYRWSELDPEDARLFAEKTRHEQERLGKSADALWAERGGILAEFGRIVCIGFGHLRRDSDGWRLRVGSYQGQDEYDLLVRFADLLNRAWADGRRWLCAHNGKEFDIPWVARRCLVHRIALPSALDIAGLKPWEVGHLDTMHLWRFGDHKHFTSLELLARTLGIPSPKEGISGKDIARVYYEEGGLERIAAYCRRDVAAVAQVYLRLTGGEAVANERIEMV